MNQTILKRPVPHDFVAQAAHGDGIRALMQHYGVRHGTIAEWASDCGIEVAMRPVDGKRPNYRKAVEDMRPLDAVEYLLTVIEDLLPPRDQVADVRLHGFSETQAEMLLVLTRSKFLSYSHATAIVMRGRDRDKSPNHDAVRVYISAIRKRIAAMGGGIKILNEINMGWRIEREKGFKFPWESA